MKSARRGRLASITLFMLVVILIVGGMSWATVATLELAKHDLGEERSNTYERNIALALGRLDTHVGIVLGNEIARPFTDYFPYETVEVVEVWSAVKDVLFRQLIVDCKSVTARLRSACDELCQM